MDTDSDNQSHDSHHFSDQSDANNHWGDAEEIDAYTTQIYKKREIKTQKATHSIYETKQMSKRQMQQNLCWQCSRCNAVNNLLFTLTTYDMKCHGCDQNTYNATVKMFESKEWMKGLDNVWPCDRCTFHNPMNTKLCLLCQNENESEIRNEIDSELKLQEKNKLDAGTFAVEHHMFNPLVIIIGVIYNNKVETPWETLPQVEDEVNKMRKLWENTLQFDTEILTDYVEYKNCSKDDILRFLNKCMSKLKDTKSKERYDGLICVVSARGVSDSFIAGDGQPIDIKENLFVRFGAHFVPGLAFYPKGRPT